VSTTDLVVKKSSCTVVVGTVVSTVDLVVDDGVVSTELLGVVSTELLGDVSTELLGVVSIEVLGVVSTALLGVVPSELVVVVNLTVVVVTLTAMWAQKQHDPVT